MTRSAVIVDAIRTPGGKRNGLLGGWHETDHFLHTEARPAPQLITGFIDAQRAWARGDESVCEVLQSQGLQVAPRTFRSWKNAEPSTRERNDAVIVYALRATARIDARAAQDNRDAALVRPPSVAASPRPPDDPGRHGRTTPGAKGADNGSVQECGSTSKTNLAGFHPT